jgi:GntR family transcriptional regulator
MADPLYRQIAEELHRKIDSGEYAPGAQLPTEDVLIEEHHTSRNTVRAAIKELTTFGLVETRHGIGTFVIEQVPPIVTTLTTDPETGSGGGEGLVYTAEVAQSGRRAESKELRVEIQQADPAVADALRIEEGAGVILRNEQRYVDDVPWSIQTSYYPQSLISRAPRLLDAASIEEGTVKYLTGCGIQQAGYRDSLAVRPPNDGELSFFGLPADGRIQVIEIYRITFDQEGKRARLTITVYRADRNRFVINVGDVQESAGLRPAESNSAALVDTGDSPTQEVRS